MSAPRRLSPDLWARRVRTSSYPWVVVFHTPWCQECPALVAEWRKVATALDGSELELGTVNCDVHRQFCARMHLPRYPTVQLLVPGDDELQEAQVWGAYKGPLTAARIVDWIEEEFTVAQEALVTSLTDATFAKHVLASEPLWLVQFTAPHAAWCASCANLAPLVRRMSAFLKGHIRFGLVDCEAEPQLCRRYSLGKPYGAHEGDFPQLLGFAKGKYKAAPDRLLPAAIGSAGHLEEHVDGITRTLRLALSVVPEWAKKRDGEGNLHEGTHWTRLTDEGSGRVRADTRHARGHATRARDTRACGQTAEREAARGLRQSSVAGRRWGCQCAARGRVEQASVRSHQCGGAHLARASA